MNELLEKLTKEDLIKVIATMHDTIQEWDNGYGLIKKEYDILIGIGSACTSYCVEVKDWKLPKLN